MFILHSYNNFYVICGRGDSRYDFFGHTSRARGYIAGMGLCDIAIPHSYVGQELRPLSLVPSPWSLFTQRSTR